MGIFLTSKFFFLILMRLAEVLIRHLLVKTYNSN